ncbi:MAG: alpha-galactosidase [Victivallaceae bacterium]
MPIFFDSEKRLFKLDTPGLTYAFLIDRNLRCAHLYFGPKIGLDGLWSLYRPTVRAFCPYPASGEPADSPDMLPLEFAPFGTGDFRTPSAVVSLAGGDNVTDPRYVSHRIFRGKPVLQDLPASFGSENDAETLEVTLRDEISKIEFILSYSVFADSDAVARSVKAINRGDTAARIEKLASCTLDFADGELDIVHLWGSHCRERYVERQALPHGMQTFESTRGLSSHQHNPAFALCSPDATDASGRVYGIEFVYSGDFLAEAGRDQFDTARALIGLNPATFGWKLDPGAEFQAPEVLLTASDDGFDGMSRNFHRFIRRHLLRSWWKDRKRPVLINNWEATYFNFDTEKLLAVARDAAELGLDMLVLDDGWFGCRDNDDNSLGDWFVYEKKLPGGLKHLVSEVNKLGLKFGLWFEPEMISENSELHRKHPDWVLEVPGRERSLGRNQMMLDMSRPEVVDFIFSEMCAILDSANIEYIKWDANRHMTEAGSRALPADRQKETRHRYMLGVYRLHQLLLDRYPKLLIEGCSGGGGRFDAGMLFYVPQIWTSDDSDAIERLKIQYGTSLFYPCSTMGAHVSDSPNHQTGRDTRFETRGVVALSGTFGYELDLNKMNDEQRKMIEDQIADFHRLNHLVREGDLYRLTDPFANQYYCAWMQVAPGREEFLLSYVQSRCVPHGPLHSVQLRGLDPDKSYLCEFDGVVYSGSLLMNAGFPLPPFGYNCDGRGELFHFEAVE